MRKMAMLWMIVFSIVLTLPSTFAQEQNLFYDQNGNLISGDGFQREYNGFNQLIRIRNASGGILEEMTWHPTEERTFIKKTYYSNGSLHDRITYLTPNTIKIKNSSGTYYENYIYQEGMLVAQIDADGNRQAVHDDHLGSASLLTDVNGNVVESTFYSPFGEILEGGDGRMDYTGKEFDSLTKTLAPDVQQQYHRAVAQALDKKSPEELNKIFPLLSDGPDGIATEWVRSHKAEENIALINDPATPAPVRDKILKQRAISIQKLKDAKNVGIIIEIKPGQRFGNPKYLVDKLKEQHKEVVVITMSEITPEKIMNFYNIDAFIELACPRIAIDDYAKYPKPILTFKEALVALGEKSWEDILKRGVI